MNEFKRHKTNDAESNRLCSIEKTLTEMSHRIDGVERLLHIIINKLDHSSVVPKKAKIEMKSSDNNENHSFGY